MKESSGWVKFFADGTVETGFDEDVIKKRASWRHGRLANMTGAMLRHNRFLLSLDTLVPAEFWQSDDFEFDMASGNHELVRRRISCNLGNSKREFAITRKNNLLALAEGAGLGAFVCSDWLVLELDVKKNTAQFYSLPERK